MLTATDSSIHTFRPRQNLPIKEKAFWLLKRGAVKTFTWDEGGKPMTLGYWGAGDLIGQPLSLFQPYRMKCLTVVEASCVSLDRWNCLSDEIRRHVQQTEELLYIVRSERIHQRLLKVLNWLAQKFGREVEEGKIIQLPLTHQELAEITGTTRVTVTRTINQFEQQGIISRPQRHCILLRSLFLSKLTTGLN